LKIWTALKNKQRWKRWGKEALIFLLLFIALIYWQRRGLLPADGQQAPEVMIWNMEGQPLPLKSFQGKRLMLHFWATWCSVCALEHAALNAVYEDLEPDEALLALVVAPLEEREKIRAYIAAEGIKYPVYFAGDEAQQAFQVKSFPSNYFLSPTGKITGRDVGMSSRWGMAWRLNQAEDG